MTHDSRTIQNNIRLPYNWSLGSTWTKFFNFLKNDQIYGTRCNRCNKTFVPARSFCPECYFDMEEWIEVGQEGTLQSWAIVNRSYPGQVKTPPYVVASIHLDGADTNFCHFIAGTDFKDISVINKILTKGMHVRAVWREDKKGDINDISYFEPVIR